MSGGTRTHYFFSGPMRGGTVCHAAIEDEAGFRQCGRPASEHSLFDVEFEADRWSVDAPTVREWLKRAGVLLQ